MSKNKVHIKTIAPYRELYRDPKTGIAWVENGSTGNGHSCHPNIHYTGSVRGMKKLGHWEKTDRIVRSHGYYHNIEMCVIDDELDQIACNYCQCGGVHRRRESYV
jgi:hypothetical protein